MMQSGELNPEGPSCKLIQEPCCSAVVLTATAWVDKCMQGSMQPGLCPHADFALHCPASAAADPFSSSGDAYALSGASPETVRPTGDIDHWFRKLCQAGSGVLYEDQYLQVSSVSCMAARRSQATFVRRLHGGLLSPRLVTNGHRPKMERCMTFWS